MQNKDNSDDETDSDMPPLMDPSSEDGDSMPALAESSDDYEYVQNSWQSEESETDLDEDTKNGGRR